jgi:hypothetical protein
MGMKRAQVQTIEPVLDLDTQLQAPGTPRPHHPPQIGHADGSRWVLDDSPTLLRLNYKMVFLRLSGFHERTIDDHRTMIGVPTAITRPADAHVLLEDEVPRIGRKLRIRRDIQPAWLGE